MNPKRSGVYRGDIIRAYLAYQRAQGEASPRPKESRADENLSAIAQTLGFQRQSPKSPSQAPVPPKKAVRSKPAVEQPPVQQQAPALAETPQTAYDYAIPFYRVKQLVPSKPTADEALSDDDTILEPLAKAVIKRPPMAKVKRSVLQLWPHLEKHLSKVLQYTRNSRQIDAPLLTRNFAQRWAMANLPYQQQAVWHPQVDILIDLHIANRPFVPDFFELISQLKKWRGDSGLRIYTLYNGDLSRCQVLGEEHRAAQAYPLGVHCRALLILSDIGLYSSLYSTHTQRLNQWLALGRQCLKQGLTAQVLAPVPPRLQGAARRQAVHKTGLQLWTWDRHEHSPKHRQAQDLGVEAVFQVLATLPRCDAEIIRHARMSLPKRWADVGTEAIIALQERTNLVPDSQALYRIDRAHMLTKLQSLTQQQQAQAYRVLQQLRSSVPEVLIAESAYAFYQALNTASRQQLTSSLALEADYRWAHDYLARYCAALEADRQHPDALQTSQLQVLKRSAWRMPSMGLQHTDLGRRYLHTLAFQYWQDMQNKGGTTLPSAFSASEVVRHAGQVSQTQDYALVQAGEQFVVLPAEQASTGSYLLPSFETDYLQWLYIDKDSACDELVLAQAAFRVQGMNSQAVKLACPSPQQQLVVKMPSAYYVIESMQQPTWAESMERDQYGLRATLMVDDIAQHFRWMAPGRFLMGSPDTEPERYDDEVQHEVTLTQGFWLAETACSQALWQAVVGDNPSHFKAQSNWRDLPIENVSWDEVQSFMTQLRRRLGGIALRLPTEAEWEYACRAGTQTPFAFGSELSLAMANYGAQYPYHQGKAESSAEAALPVESLYRNSWGLYQMHGNVSELCADWHADYPSDPVTDPVGPASGNRCVLRGGSWVSFGRLLRSAYRSSSRPGNRLRGFGFRLALG